MKKITLSIIFLILMSILVYSIVQVGYISPDDGKTLILGGAVEGNLSFEVNATPTGSTGVIDNATLYTNISGTWSANFTNLTDGTVGLISNRLFPGGNSNISIFSRNLVDGSVFIWNVYACDNISIFYNETVSLTSEEYTIFDNVTSSACTAANNATNCIIITAGRGQLANYPVSTLDATFNNTGGAPLAGACTLNGSNEGFFYCNQTRRTYNGSGDSLQNDTLITSSVKASYTISSSCRFVGENRTVYVEDAPSVTLNLPADSGYDSDGTIAINFSVTGDSDIYTCQVYSNDTGSWSPDGGANTAINNTDKTTSKVFTQGNGIVWNVLCAESANSDIYGWAVNNYTISVNTANPVVTILSPEDNSYSNSKYSDGYSARVYLNVTDSNADSCAFKLDGIINITNSYTTGIPFYQYFNASDAAYEWNTVCNDSAGNTYETTNRTITIDTVIPTKSSNTNYSSTTADCKGFTVNFTFSEDVNASFTFGTTSMAQTHKVVETDYAVNQTLTLTFNNSYNTDYYSNISACDRSGNCNDSFPEMTIPSPIGLCTGWTSWSVYDSAINLSDYRTASGADYVYYWNNTGQSWIYSSAAGSSNEGYSMGIGDVTHLYESTNDTYFRNVSGTPGYYVNVTGGHVYFGLYHAYSFGNISYVIFKNSTSGTTTPSDIWQGGVSFQVDYYSGFNNSNQLYVDAIYNWSWNNATTLGINYKNGIDTLWSYIDYNLSINFTPDGEVIGNWT